MCCRQRAPAAMSEVGCSDPNVNVRFVLTLNPRGGTTVDHEDFGAEVLGVVELPQSKTLDADYLRTLVYRWLRASDRLIALAGRRYIVADVRSRDKTRDIETIILTRP